MKVFVMSMMIALMLAEVLSLSQYPGRHYTKVMVSASKLVLIRREGVFPILANASVAVTCSMLCNTLPWCELWCQEVSGECRFFDTFVRTWYVETNTADAIPCYTAKSPDLLAQATISGTDVEPAVPIRVVDNLLRGKYDRISLNQCYHPKYEWYSYFLVALPYPMRVTGVSVYSRPKAPTAPLAQLNNMDVFYGNAPPATAGDFSSYSVMGVLTVTDVDQWVVLQPATPIVTQYIAFQKKWNSQYQACWLEVF